MVRFRARIDSPIKANDFTLIFLAAIILAHKYKKIVKSMFIRLSELTLADKKLNMGLNETSIAAVNAAMSFFGNTSLASLRVNKTVITPMIIEAKRVATTRSINEDL